MSALALAMMLTGAGAVRPAEPAYPVIVAPAPVEPARIGPPAPPSPPGYDRAARPPQRARMNFNSYFSEDDYPVQALRERHQGTTGVRLTVGANGRVVSCQVTATSGSGPLDAATCRILRSRARYTPARDAEGNPAEGNDSARITWRLPDRDRDAGERAGIPIPATRAVLRGRIQDLFTARDYPVPALRAREAGQTIIRLVVGTNGRVIACDVAASSRSEALDAAACRIVRARARYAPARSAAGAPACDVFFGPVEWVLPPLPRRLPRARPATVPPPIEDQLAPDACPGAIAWDDAQPLMSPPLVRMLAPAPPAPPPPPVSVQPPQRARSNLSTYFSTDDYPTGLEREEGTSSFRVTIGPDGRVSDCMITQSSGVAALDETTCRILRSRARYTPARDSFGNPTTGSDSGRVTWRFPEETETPAERRAGIPVPFTPAVPRAPLQSYVSARDYPAAALRARELGISSLRLVIGMTGRVIACDVDDTSPSAALGAAACRIARARARYAPARSQAGGFVCDVDFDEIWWRPPPGRRAGRDAAAAATAPAPVERQLAPGSCPGRAP